MKYMKPEAIIFDMDGVLIDSEPIWRKVEFRIFADLGVPLTSVEETHVTMGLRCDEVTEYWYTRYPWPTMSKDAVTQKIIEEVISDIKKQGVAMQGAHDAILAAKLVSNYTAIASSSPLLMIEAVVGGLQLPSLDILHSAENEAKGKPSPDVYLTTAKKLGADPRKCIAIEDSVNGIKSAKAAGMYCIAVPDTRYLSHEEAGAYADVVVQNLVYCTETFFNQLIPQSSVAE